MSTEKEIPNLDESSENWSKIKDKDKWLDEVRGNEEKELSAMQELIKKIDFVIGLWLDPKNEMDGLHTLNTLKKDAKSLLPKEKAQTVGAYDAGKEQPSNSQLCPIDYYNNKYNQ